MVTPEHVQRWCDDYIAAWRSYDRDAIRALFADDVVLRLPPLRRAAPRRRRRRRAPGSRTGTSPARGRPTYAPALVAGDRAIVTGESRYADGEVFSNLWQLEFAADGRCTRFVEWYVLHPKDE